MGRYLIFIFIGLQSFSQTSLSSENNPEHDLLEIIAQETTPPSRQHEIKTIPDTLMAIEKMTGFHRQNKYAPQTPIDTPKYPSGTQTSYF